MNCPHQKGRRITVTDVRRNLSSQTEWELIRAGDDRGKCNRSAAIGDPELAAGSRRTCGRAAIHSVRRRRRPAVSTPRPRDGRGATAQRPSCSRRRPPAHRHPRRRALMMPNRIDRLTEGRPPDPVRRACAFPFLRGWWGSCAEPH
ncbi:hypothetical protein SEVIR_1G314932v4 [Setaria viridis]